MIKMTADPRLIIIILLLLVVYSVYFFRDQHRNNYTEQPLELYTLNLAGKRLTVMRSSDNKDQGTTPADLAPILFKKIPINQADQLLLQTISGIGPDLAEKIISERDRHGHFASSSDLLRVKGIGQKRKEWLEYKLNFD